MHPKAQVAMDRKQTISLGVCGAVTSVIVYF